MKKMMLMMLLVVGVIFAGTPITAGEVIGDWQFNDASNPGKDSSTAENELQINGKPIVKNGVITLRGGQWKQPRNEKEFLYNNTKALDLGNESFSVECWFKSPIISYMKLVGTRNTIRPRYKSQRGWALGLSKGNGSIVFVVSDKQQKVADAGIKIAKSSWDGDEWNYLVGIRDRQTKTVKLYLNGKLAATQSDGCGDVTRSGKFNIGYDGYAGCMTQGSFREIKITKGVLTANTIAKNYKTAANATASSDKQLQVSNKITIPATITIDISDGLNGKLNLQPVPVELKYQAEYRPLQQLAIRFIGNPTAQQKVAAEILTTDLKQQLNIKVKIVDSVAQADGGTVIEIGKALDNKHQESYKLQIAEKKISLTSPDHGIIYGALTLVEIIAQSSLINNAKVSLPKTLNIYDYPAIPRRIEVRLLAKNLTDSDARINHIMLRIARTRLNYYTIQPMLPSLNNIKRLIDIAAKYGIKVMATVSFQWESKKLKRAMTLDDMAKIMERFSQFAKAGGKGFSFHFDDITGYGKTAAEFPGGAGAFQRQFLIAVQQTAKEDNIDFVSTCPTLYMRHWKSVAAACFGKPENSAGYFKKISQLPLGDIDMFYTDIVGIADLKNHGVRRPAYYLNGVWGSKQMFSVYTGPNRLSWSWYGFDIDPTLGPVSIPDAMKAWRNITDHGVEAVWVGSSHTSIAGIWMWNPKQFNENDAIREINRIKWLGAGTFAAMLNFEKNSLPLVALFKTYVNSWTNEFHVKTLKRQHPLNQADLVAYWNNYLQAKQALLTIKQTIKQQPQVYRPKATKRLLREMQKTLNLFKTKLIRKLKSKNIVIK